MGEPVPRWRVLKLRFFDDRKREFPGKNEISGPHCGQKWGPEAVEPSFSPGKTAEKKRNFKKREQGALAGAAGWHPGITHSHFRCAMPFPILERLTLHRAG